VEGRINHVVAVEVCWVPIWILCQHFIYTVLLRKMFDLEISRWSLDGITFTEGRLLEGMEDVLRDDPALSVLLRLRQPIISRLKATTIKPLRCNVHRSVSRPERMLVQALSEYLLSLLHRRLQEINVLLVHLHHPLGYSLVGSVPQCIVFP